MGTSYTRNDTSNNIADGNIINATDLDGEFDAIQSAFATTGHTHDGTAAEGGPITVAGPTQDLVVSATNVNPKTTNTLDLGTSSLLYKDSYLQGVMYFRDTGLKVLSSTDGQLDIDADAELELTSPIVDINASTGLALDGANLNSAWTVNTNNKIQFRDTGLYINSSVDGQLDIVADTEIQIAATTIDINGAINASGEIIAASLDISGNIDVDGTTNLDVVDIDGAVDMATTLAVAGNVDFNGDLDVDGTTNLDVVDIDGAVDMATTLAVAGNVDFNGDLDVDGITNLDVVDIDGAVNIAAATTVTDANKVQFRDTAIYLNSSTDGQLDIVADTEIQIAATTVDINGAVALNGAITGATNITLSGELDAATGDFSGDVDVDGTLEADAITVNGTALATVIAGTTVTNATNAAHVSVADNESTNEENLITFIEDASATGNVGLESDGDFSYNPSTGTVTATVFKGNVDAVDIDVDGTLEADAITIGGTAIASVLSPVAGSSSIVTTGALDAGSITSGFGTIDNGASAITTTGALGAGATTVTTFTSTGIDDNASSTALTLDSSQNATFAGEVNVGTTASGDGTLNIIASTGEQSIIEFSDTTNSRGRIYYDHASSPEKLILETTGTTAMSIDNSQDAIFAGTVSVETSGVPTLAGGTPYGLLIRSGGANSNGTYQASIGFTESSDTLVRAAIMSKQTGADNDQHGLAFMTHPSASDVDGSIALLLEHDMNATFAGNIDAVAGGINLGATGAANLLDDYETGSWTPTIVGSTTAGTYTVATGSSARYEKVGSLVHVGARITFDAAGSGGGAIILGGLPFNYASGSLPSGTYLPNAVSLPIGDGGMCAVMLPVSSGADSRMVLSIGSDGAGASNVLVTGLTTSSQIYLDMTYRV